MKTIENQSGRTLLEMLGVLVIMGVITYGAIAGINYGMASYKINQTYAEVQDIIQGIQDLYSWSQGYPTNSKTIMKAACENDIFPNDCVEKATGHEYLAAPFGSIAIEAIDGGRNFKIIVGVSDANSRTRLANMDWNGIRITAYCGGNLGSTTPPAELHPDAETCVFAPQ